jgi:glycerol uptake facilitator-like aquaporin
MKNKMEAKTIEYKKIGNIFQSCEYLGSMFLVIAAISPVILFHEILESNIAIAVLADSIAVGFTLYALIEIFSPICTSFFNPAVTIAFAITGKITWKKSAIYSINQILGGFTGLLISHLMFYHEIPKLVEISTISRSGGSYLAEILGTFFLVLAIFSLVQQNSKNTSQIIGFLVAGMLLATSSTMFANPQVTFARIFTYSIAGISPIDGLIFVTMQIIGTLLAIATWKTMKFRCCDYTCSE